MLIKLVWLYNVKSIKNLLPQIYGKQLKNFMSLDKNFLKLIGLLSQYPVKVIILP